MRWLNDDEIIQLVAKVFLPRGKEKERLICITGDFGCLSACCCALLFKRRQQDCAAAAGISLPFCGRVLADTKRTCVLSKCKFSFLE